MQLLSLHYGDAAGAGRKQERNAIEGRRRRNALTVSGEDNITRGSGEVGGRLAENGSDEEEILSRYRETAAATKKGIAARSGV